MSVRIKWGLTPILLCAATAPAQSIAGAWEGLVSGQRIGVTLDSSANGWRGAVLVPGFRGDSMRLTLVLVGRDSVEFRLPPDALSAVFRGALSSDRVRLSGYAIVGADSNAAFRLARKGSPQADEILADYRSAAPSEPPRAHQDPDSARLITSDITLFWDVLARAPADSLELYLRRDYLNKGTPGLRDFIPGRIVSAADLALYVQRSRERYESRRAANFRVSEAEAGIRAAFHELKRIYPEAVFPDVYFVIGRFNSGGTASRNGLLVGAEMYSDPARFPSIVAHELIHYQQVQTGGPRTLLAQSFHEGTADFVSEMISGVHINNTAHAYGMAHERELWQEFKQRLRDFRYTGWMYGDPPGERPADLGYFIGYRIAQAYYSRASDKAAALREIIRATDVETILAKSGYQP